MDYPYKSQWQSDAAKHRNDCGAAHVASILEAHGITRTIDSIASAIDTADDGTTADDLARVLRANGIAAQVWTGTGLPKLPALCLVKYSGFDRASVQDKNFTGWHWLMVHSINDLTAVVHDPDYWGSRINEGAFKRYSRREFDKAFIPYGASKIAVVWPEVAEVVTNRYTIRDLNNNVLGRIEGAFTVTRDVTPVPDPTPERNPTFTATPASITAGQSATLAWSNTDGASAIYLNGVGVSGPSGSKPVTPPTTTTYTLAVTYPEATVTRMAKVTVTPSPDPLPIVAPRIGLNVLFDAAAARQALSDGCRFFLVMNNTDLANELAHNGAMVMYRQYFDHAPSARECAEAVGTRVGHPSIIRTGINENEFVDGNDIAWRAAFDKEVAERLKDMNPDYRFAGGTYSMGTPDITDARIRDLMRQHYAPIYNSGLIWWDQHCYSPNATEISDPRTGVIEWDGKRADIVVSDWLSTRWRFYFWFCGFDPRVRHIVSGECGVDGMGIGGFAAQQVSGQGVVDYIRAWKAKQGQPITVDGVQYPSPFVGGAIFQAGDTNHRWDGYDMRGYFDIIRDHGAWA